MYSTPVGRGARLAAMVVLCWAVPGPNGVLNVPEYLFVDKTCLFASF